MTQHHQTNPTPRPARPADLASIERLLAISGLESTGISELLARRCDDFIVIDDGVQPGELTAVAALEVCGDDALLRSVAVHPDWRKRRLGELLVRRLTDEAKGRGLRAIYLLTTTAEHFFPKFGFARVERESVPEGIAATHEFRFMCPSSAVVMMRVIRS